MNDSSRTGRLTSARYQHHTATQARNVRAVVEDIYRRSYVDAIDSGDPFDSPVEFMRRFDAYTDPARSGGFELVVAFVDGAPAGQTWGWPLQPGAAWWGGLHLDDGDRERFTTETGERTFALSEIMVCTGHSGRGLARALHNDLLSGRREQRATLLVEPDNDRAYAAYRKWGWVRVGWLRPDWEDAPKFDVLIRDLPL
ncbi:GNAT family N-acetyltransferase [Nocardia zapadnayensis]|uniref:GNAT family N-acetyltransferase n=1 Tax=Nocardia rhamnosiphila TaxID=426716 RepID=UPI002246D81B|nr:GNAT family N-acetyltransferase [Nocardia zapadnayensis]MCX0275127.1 GNAT family N-acetyltransferase [Nocardia zapadnayensis]